MLDDGLQPERTALAWRRTALSLTAGGLVGLRVLPPAAGVPGLGAAVLAVLGGVALWFLGDRRARAVSAALAAPRPTARAVPAPSPLPGGALLLTLAAVVAVCAALLAVGTAVRHL